MIEIDGSHGEGGGQVLRTALALSLVTGRAFRIDHIRAGRKNPGLQNQHLAAVMAAHQAGGAEIAGAELKSQSLSFDPQGVFPGDYRFSVGTAGSTTLVLQTVLPALMRASGGSRLLLEGGTHNPWAPPFEFLEKTYLPVLRKMGPALSVELEQAGFHPQGGGRLRMQIEPAPQLSALELTERGRIRRMHGRAQLAHLPEHIAERELDVLRKRLHIERKFLAIEKVQSAGPGNALLVEVECERWTCVFSSIGRVRLPAEKVARQLVREVRAYQKCGAPVDVHLADQLLVPMAVAGRGTYVTAPLSRHARTNIDIIKAFLDVDISVNRENDDRTVRVIVSPPG